MRRTKKENENDWRRFLAAACLTTAAIIFMLSGCASPRGVPDYDGDLIPQDAADSTTYVKVHIENHRTVDALAPTIYLTGSGRHSLGRIEGMGGKIDRLVDTSWFGADGCLQLSAHYVGSGDLVFDRLCWRPHETITASLDNIFVSGSAWSHR